MIINLVKKQKKTVVSVVIPTYNASKIIVECIQSVCRQSFTSFEILVVDDCSTDNTRQIIKNMKITNLRLFKTKVNSGGPAKPRNIGISKSRGQYIAFLDQDDLWEKNKLRTCINENNKPETI